MTLKYLSVLACVFSLCVVPSAFAQEMTTIATVNISNASIVSEAGRSVVVGFDISNRVGVQPEVRYALTLSRLLAGHPVPVATKVFDHDTLALVAHETVHKEIVYTLPPYLSGQFVVGLEARNASGLLYAYTTIEKAITVESTVAPVEVRPCALRLGGNAEDVHTALPKELPAIRLVAPGQTLIADCPVTNSAIAQDIVPTVETRAESSFGPVVDTHTQAAATFGAGQARPVSISLYVPTKPGSYEALVTFRDAHGAEVASSQRFQYVVQGASATIRNVVLDKDTYQKGDVALLSVFYGGQKVTSMNFSLKDGNGNACAADVAHAVATTTRKSVEEIAIPITSRCVSPTVGAQLSDAHGGILYQHDFAITSRNIPQPASRAVMLWAVIGLVVVLGMLLFVSRRNGMLLVAIAVAFASMLGGAEKAKADTYTFSAPDNMWCSPAMPEYNICDDVVITANIGPTPIYPSSTMTVDGKMSLYNRYTIYDSSVNYDLIDIYVDYSTWELFNHGWFLSGVVNNSSKTFFNAPTGSGTNMCKTVGNFLNAPLCPASGSGTFTAPSQPGTYYANFTATLLWADSGIDKSITKNFSFAYTVVPLPTGTNGACGTANGKTYPYTASGYGSDTQCAAGTPSANWLFPAAGATATWTCSGQNGGTNASCSASHEAALPDLVSGPVKQNSAVAGTALKLSADITNSGTAITGSPAFVINFEKASNSACTSGLSSLDTVNRGTSLGINKTFTATTSLLTFGSAQSFYVHACADSTRQVTESNEQNNCGPCTLFTVTPSAAPIAGVCGTAQYACDAGTPYNKTENATSWLWGCAGLNGGSSTADTACSLIKAARPSVMIDAAPKRVFKNGKVVVTWVSDALNGCRLTKNPDPNGWSFSTQDAGGTKEDTVATQTTYSVVCTSGTLTSNRASVIVNVVPDFTPY